MRKSGKIILGLVAGVAVVGVAAVGVAAVASMGVMINYLQGKDYLYGDDFDDEFENDFEDDLD